MCDSLLEHFPKYAPIFTTSLTFQTVVSHLKWKGYSNLGPSTVYQQPWHRVRSFSILIGCNLNDESVRKILKTQLRYEISNGLQLQSMKDQETVLRSHENNSWTMKCLICIKDGMFLGWQRK